jgi:hypothetical protein
MGSPAFDTTVFSRVLYQLSYLAATASVAAPGGTSHAKKGRPGRCYRAANVLCV